MDDPITQISVNNKFYQLTDIIYYTRETGVYIGHPLEIPKHKYAIKKPIPKGITYWVIREANTLRQIMHPNIVRYIDHSEDSEESYLVMELVPDTLDSLIRDETVSKEVIIKYIEQMPSFLRIFHHLGIAHTNINPDNLGYDDDGTIKVLDLSDAVPCHYSVKQKIKSICASVLSPEYLLNGEITPMTDMYCAARVLECLLFGDYVIAQKPILTLQEGYKHLPQSFFDLYTDMTKKDPLDRLHIKELKKRVDTVVKDLRNIEIFTTDLLTNIK